MIVPDNISEYLRSTDGVNQLQRSLPALDPNFVRIDNRSKSNIISFLKELSKQIRFYNLNNQSIGNWSPFFDNIDTTDAILVKVATTSPLPSVTYLNGVNGVGATLTATAIGPLLSLDGIPLANGDLLLVWKQEEPLENGMYVVNRQGTNTTTFILQRFENSDQSTEFNQQIVEIEQGFENGRAFFIQQTTNPVIGISDIIYVKGGLSRKDWSPGQALFLAFLHLFSIAQRDMNELTGRHLRYYYEQVLQLKRKPAQSDQVHVVFEPTKNAPPVLLPAGTLLDAGKTPDGKSTRQYALDNDIVVNHAVVKSVKSTYTDRNSTGDAIIFKTDDATTVTSNTSTAWRPFGSTQLSLSPESRTMTEAKLGFAIASPALLLAEGDRTITLTLTITIAQTTIQAPDPDIRLDTFEIALTGNKGWITPSVTTTLVFPIKESSIVTPGTFSFEIKLSAADDALIAYNEALHGTGYKTSWPILQCFIQPYAFQIGNLAPYIIINIDIEVKAVGIKNLILQNDETIQPIDKPILPFTSQPHISDNFYIGSAEVFSKKLKSLSVALEWQDPPDDFTVYYNGYDNLNIGYSKFLTNIFLLAGKSWVTSSAFSGFSLFNGGVAASNTKIIDIDSTSLQNFIEGSAYKRKPDIGKIEGFSSGTDQGFIKLVLIGPTKDAVGNKPEDAPFEAFGHKSYPVIYTRKAIGLSKTPIQGDGILPNQPYTPTLKSVTLDYSAKESFIPSVPNGIEQFFLLDAFGNAELDKNKTAYLLPSFPAQGALYIGLDKVTPPQTVSFLFQIERGNFPGVELLKKADMYWSYLADNQWQPLAAGDILEDSTEALQQPGILRLNIGSDASSASLLMPVGLYWVKLSVNERGDGASAIQEVAAQAVRATLVSNIQDTQVQTIQPKTISRLVNKLSAIKSVKQDYPSFNGSPVEADANFFRRISERLRHRSRAVTAWDYERLVLEAFPGVFKVKCLPYTDEENKILPGHIKLVLVPDLRVHKSGDLLQPKNNLVSLSEIEAFLKEKYLSSFVEPHAANPAYETLLVDCKVSFLSGFDPGFYTEQLQEDIRRFLSPWAYEEGQDIIFGGKIYKSEILAFVEGRPYVDYIINFKLYHRFEGVGLGIGISCMTIGTDFIVENQPSPMVGSIDNLITGGTIGVDFVIGQPVEIAVATRPDAILVSDTVHRIKALQAEGFVCSGVSSVGISQMIISLDFIVVS